MTFHNKLQRAEIRPNTIFPDRIPFKFPPQIQRGHNLLAMCVFGVPRHLIAHHRCRNDAIWTSRCIRLYSDVHIEPDSGRFARMPDLAAGAIETARDNDEASAVDSVTGSEPVRGIFLFRC